MASSSHWPAARLAGSGGGVESGAKNTRVSWLRPAAVVAVAISLCCYTFVVVATPVSSPTEAVSMRDTSAIGRSGVSKNAERVIQSAVRKAVSVCSSPPSRIVYILHLSFLIFFCHPVCISSRSRSDCWRPTGHVRKPRQLD